jgi:hypothetical protein
MTNRTLASHFVRHVAPQRTEPYRLIKLVGGRRRAMERRQRLRLFRQARRAGQQPARGSRDEHALPASASELHGLHQHAHDATHPEQAGVADPDDADGFPRDHAAGLGAHQPVRPLRSRHAEPACHLRAPRSPKWPLTAQVCVEPRPSWMKPPATAARTWSREATPTQNLMQTCCRNPKISDPLVNGYGTTLGINEDKESSEGTGLNRRDLDVTLAK